ncbi:17851_t:CDS:2 [Funneliformis geosporum]|uniref:17851_t:CDS:1 n=1 Tax=Funneliformis geosporum TaxID=1117311 RepID=A0A9W4WJC4_9GLOM|nr:17851_t:CDS:2 [Funneliformis geosporum]
MYAGIFDLKEQTCSDILDLIIAFDELLLDDELITFIQNYLIKYQTRWLQHHCFMVLHKVFRLENCQRLQNYCLRTICDNPESFFNSPDFPTLEKGILLELVRREDLKIGEIKLWNSLIKWGMAQTSELRENDATNLSSWSKKDFIYLKIALNQFITHIRFFEISSNDFHSEIWPFRKVLPEVLFEDIVFFYITKIKPDQNKLAPRHRKDV